MVYDTGFSIEGKQYRMRGRKYIEPSPPWRLWPATTTLYVQLFPVNGRTGEPVAAGVLRITLPGFIRQLMTMRVIGDFGFFDKCIQKLSFYRFFVKSLVNTYIKGRRW
jgi:cholesterol oxidase